MSNKFRPDKFWTAAALAAGLAILAPAAPAAATTYGAIAVALSDNDVAVGVAWDADSSGEASDGAMQSCNEQGIGGCHVVTEFYGGGCGYVTTGHSASDLAWITGATGNECNETCSQNGLTCKPPIGGCTH